MAKDKTQRRGSVRRIKLDIDMRSIGSKEMRPIDHVTTVFCLSVSKAAEISDGVSLPGLEANMMLVKILDFAAENPDLTRRWRDAIWGNYREDAEYRANVAGFERERVEMRDGLRDVIASALGGLDEKDVPADSVKVEVNERWL